MAISALCKGMSPQNIALYGTDSTFIYMWVLKFPLINTARQWQLASHEELLTSKLFLDDYPHYGEQIQIYDLFHQWPFNPEDVHICLQRTLSLVRGL